MVFAASIDFSSEVGARHYPKDSPLRLQQRVYITTVSTLIAITMSHAVLKYIESPFHLFLISHKLSITLKYSYVSRTSGKEAVPIRHSSFKWSIPASGRMLCMSHKRLNHIIPGSRDRRREKGGWQTS